MGDDVPNGGNSERVTTFTLFKLISEVDRKLDRYEQTQREVIQPHLTRIDARLEKHDKRFEAVETRGTSWRDRIALVAAVVISVGYAISQFWGK